MKYKQQSSEEDKVNVGEAYLIKDEKKNKWLLYRQDIKFPGILERIIKRKGRPTPKYLPIG